MALNGPASWGTRTLPAMSWSVISKMVPYTDWTSADQLFARQDLPQQLGRAITDAVAGAAQSVG